MERALSDLPRRAAHALEGHPHVIAHVLAAYRARHGLEESSLAARLCVAPENLVRLALCRRPDPHSPGFHTHVEQIAAYAGCASAPLLLLLTEPA